MKKIIKNVIPPFLLTLFQVIRVRYSKTQIRFHGSFSSFEEALSKCSGFDDPNILNKTKEAILKVKNGEAIYERDSVLFDKIQYSFPVYSSLLKIAIENNLKLNLIDFGGSLGTTYFQNKSILPENIEINWNIVEQKHYIETGNKFFADKSLNFYYTIEDVLKNKKINLLLSSGVLQGVPEPEKWIKKFCDHKFEYILLDRITFSNKNYNLLTIQQNPSSIYSVDFPNWMFNESIFLSWFGPEYEVIFEFPSFADEDGITEDFISYYWKGFLLKRKQ